MLKRLQLAFFFVAAIFFPAAKTLAVVVPFGPQNDVPLSTVTGAWGWTQIYRDHYNVDSIPVASIFSGLGTHVMIGAIRNDLGTIDVLAATTIADFMTHTAQNVTHASNGSEWYYNGGSLGFAGLGDTIAQGEADTNGPSERDRISWHTDGGIFIGEYNVSPVNVRFGWRSGDNLFLNDSSDWDKIVFTANVPEPSTILLAGFGFAAIAAWTWCRRTTLAK